MTTYRSSLDLRLFDGAAAAGPFDGAAAALVAGWGCTADEVRQWCGHPTAPVPAGMIRSWSAPPDVAAFLLVDGEDPVGYGELWVDDEEGEVELAHVIVAPDRRGQGVGRRLVEVLVAQARRHHPVVTLRVHPDNAAAQRCYLAAGFVRASAEEESAWNRLQPVDYVWMVLVR